MLLEVEQRGTGGRVKLKKHRYKIDAEDIGKALGALLRIYAADKSNPETVALQALDTTRGVQVKIGRMTEQQIERAKASVARSVARAEKKKGAEKKTPVRVAKGAKKAAKREVDPDFERRANRALDQTMERARRFARVTSRD